MKIRTLITCLALLVLIDVTKAQPTHENAVPPSVESQPLNFCGFSDDSENAMVYHPNNSGRFLMIFPVLRFPYYDALKGKWISGELPAGERSQETACLSPQESAIAALMKAYAVFSAEETGQELKINQTDQSTPKHTSHEKN